jgi:hypothetical protein
MGQQQTAWYHSNPTLAELICFVSLLQTVDHHNVKTSSERMESLELSVYLEFYTNRKVAGSIPDEVNF